MNRHTPPRRMLHFLALAMLTLSLQGCSGLLTSEQPAKQYYLLKPLEATPVVAGTAGAPNLVLQVSAVPGLDTDRILALGIDARLNHYGNARWPDYLPEVLTSVIQRSLEETGHFTSVRAGDRAAEGGWLLQLEVREFYGIQDAAGNTSSVRINLSGGLACRGDRHSLTLNDSEPVAEQRLASIVAAHQYGLDTVTQQLTEQISDLCGPGDEE